MWEDLVIYVVKIKNYAVVLEQMTRKNWSITRKKIANYADIYKTVPKGIFSAGFMTKQDGGQSHNIPKQNGAIPFSSQRPRFHFFKCPS